MDRLSPTFDAKALRAELDSLARHCGFQSIGVASAQAGEDACHLQTWVAHGYHGEMHYMERHGSKRWQPGRLVPGTLTVISARMDYWPDKAADAHAVLGDADTAYISRYALGRDYHKVLRHALEQLAQSVADLIGPFGYRVFVDSGPVLEKAYARNAGLGWIGKHTNLIARDAGSWFFLGELLTDLPLAPDAAATAHCGTCTACIPACPTGAIVAPYQLDARRCISYLTIELAGAIPVELRRALGNRIYGCDDCQLVCPWNKFAQAASHPDFRVRHSLDGTALAELFVWTEAEFDERMRGSAIYRIGYERWSRNIAVALGNSRSSDAALKALRARREDPSPLVREHVAWAIAQHEAQHLP
jgi:epoxyqueuosine reductase